jgi:hypothetical protein
VWFAEKLHQVSCLFSEPATTYEGIRARCAEKNSALTKRRFLSRTVKHGRQGKRFLLTPGGPNQTIEVGHAGQLNSP